MAKLTPKQQKFADYYIETGNATEAAIRAGYSKKTAKVIGAENLTKPYLKSYIDERLKALEDERIADIAEVMKFLTAAMRGEIKEEVVIVENMGDFTSEAKIIKKEISAKERIKSAELIGKRYAMWTEKVNLEADVGVQIVDDIGSEYHDED